MAVEQLNHHPEWSGTSLHFVNPEYVTWKYEEILFALPGGISKKELHSMRVTLKADFKTSLSR